MEATLRTPLSNLQLELLKLYARQVSDSDLSNIKEIIGRYFAERLTKMADEAWEKNNWTDEDMERILNDPNQ